MNDDRFAEHLSALIREVDPPPSAPRDAMWAHIEAARQGRRPGGLPGRARHEAGKGGIDAVPRPRPNQWLRRARWATPLAAALLIGIGIGRVFSPAAPGPARQQAIAVEEGGASPANLPYRLVAAEHLDAAEALLSALSYDAQRGDVDVVSDWAEDLLVTTRLLLDSPAAEDPHMSRLFQDLELVLAQIASIPASDAEGEVQLIEEGIRQNNVLLRVRAATMQRAAAGT